MKYTGRATVHPNSPVGFGICDKCNFLYNLPDLLWQMDYRGMQLQKTGFRVCQSCYDIPNPQRRPIIIPQDPVPLLNPRVQDYTPSRDDYLATQGALDQISTEADVPLVVQETLDVDDMT